MCVRARVLVGFFFLLFDRGSERRYSLEGMSEGRKMKEENASLIDFTKKERCE